MSICLFNIYNLTREENQKIEQECKRVEEENAMAKDNLKKESSIIESKNRMLEQSVKSIQQLRNQTEKARSELKQ